MTQTIPTCVGVIMDGNRRFAQEQGIPKLEGHRRGYEKLKKVCQWAHGVGIQHVIAYAFSTENWNRSKEEVSYLMDLLRFILTKEINHFHKQNVRVRCIGELSLLPDDMQQLIQEVEVRTAKNNDLELVIALSYGGRREIIAATNALLSQGAIEVDEERFSKALSTYPTPDPDLIIRTGGHNRLSNFLLWQAAYSELVFTNTHWPAFTEEEFQTMLKRYAEQQRNFGH